MAGTTTTTTTGTGSYSAKAELVLWRRYRAITISTAADVAGLHRATVHRTAHKLAPVQHGARFYVSLDECKKMWPAMSPEFDDLAAILDERIRLPVETKPKRRRLPARPQKSN